jgi:hypothetical protein
MIIKIIVPYDTEQKRFLSIDAIEESNNSNVELVHSGSSYLRIINKTTNKQIGTIGAHCPGTEELNDRLWGRCDDPGGKTHDHISISIERRHGENK